MSKKGKPELNQVTDSSSKIEEIKNLIFGENIKQYNSEFETLKKEIDQQKAALENYIDEVRGELMQCIDSLSTDVNIRITDLEDSLTNKIEDQSEKKLDRREMGKLLITLGEKISS
jgi:hypothetical protein